MLRQYYSLTLFAIITIALGKNILHTIPQGTLMGSVMKSAKGREFHAFQGIPYAKPPIDDLRFKVPQPVEPWNGTFDATKECPACPQIDPIIKKMLVGKEDCLVLNVFIPQISTVNETSKLPVMVYIHGGSFMSGSSAMKTYSPKLIMDRHVVLVTINYRLGALGFLSTGDEVSPGNYGLYDQVEALNWVKKNIAYFGGDPQKVTLFGESSGAGCVSHLVVSPKAKDHFEAAIMQSGSSLSFWALTENSKKWAKHFAHKLGCATETSKIIRDCLKTKSAKDIVLAQTNLTIMPYTLVFTPVVENSPNGFFPEHPFKLLANNKNNKVPTISGINKDEGGFFPASIEAITDPYSPEFLETDFLELSIRSVIPENGRQAMKEVVDKYFKNIDRYNKSEVRKTVTKVFSDAGYKVGAERLTQMLSQNGLPTFTYMFSYRGQFSFTKLFGITEDYGVIHMDDLHYLFGEKNLEGDDKQVSELILDLWTNFANTHDPTPGNNLPFKWLQTEPSYPRYLDINLYPKMVNKSLTDNVEFWEDIEKITLDSSVYVQGDPLHSDHPFILDMFGYKN